MIRAQISDEIAIGDDLPLALIGGPCVIESEDLTRRIAEEMKQICSRVGLPFIFKASIDKANRTSIDAFRGVPMDVGLAILSRVKSEIGIPITTDVNESHDVSAVAEVADLLQIPAFLCRQTDLLVASAATGRAVNVKKGQFLAPWDMKYVVEKLKSGGAQNILLTERGTSFGYNTLVVDFKALSQMRELDCPVVFDASHSVQAPGGRGNASGGDRRFIVPLAKAAAATGIDALFLEVHPDPDNAPSDGPNMVPLDKLEELLVQVLRVREAAAG